MDARLKHIIDGCKKGTRSAQKELYDRYVPVLYPIALRYMKTEHEAEDVLIMGFYKIFDKLDTYTGKGNFEGWMKRIIINEALMALRKKTNMHLTVVDEAVHLSSDVNSAIDDLQYQEILTMLDDLPTGYRTVFILYVIEGYKHREIAELLDISINTSKSQLILAKKKLRAMIKKKDRI